MANPEWAKVLTNSSTSSAAAISGAKKSESRNVNLDRVRKVGVGQYNDLTQVKSKLKYRQHL